MSERVIWKADKNLQILAIAMLKREAFGSVCARACILINKKGLHATDIFELCSF